MRRKRSRRCERRIGFREGAKNRVARGKTVTWQVHGSDLEFSVDWLGLSISGTGRQFPDRLWAERTGADIRGLHDLPATWTIYRASDGAAVAREFGQNKATSKNFLDPDDVKTTTKAISVISYFGVGAGGDACIGFVAFLPDQHFSPVFELARLLAGGAPMRYWMNFEFVGVLPMQSTQETELFSYNDWLAGRPSVSPGFSFRLLPTTEADSGRK
jgi:hypothetical protein